MHLPSGRPRPVIAPNKNETSDLSYSEQSSLAPTPTNSGNSNNATSTPVQQQQQQQSNSDGSPTPTNNKPRMAQAYSQTPPRRPKVPPPVKEKPR